MKKDKIIYWVTTAIIGLMMFFSVFAYFTDPQVAAGFKHLGFADYFRVELGIAKALGAFALLIPQVPLRVKEWAYAGFGITFISASIAHFQSGDASSAVVTPLVLLVILIVSNIYLHKTKATA
ncbi:DoxX family protein [Flectobacillus major]|uniref:DoxX family protein n=1 Tax=Flectobacillus major TaxID=103 RepID=UPI0004081EC7|nr:DoxX family protein [Flectobacillus major]